MAEIFVGVDGDFVTDFGFPLPIEALGGIGGSLSLLSATWSDGLHGKRQSFSITLIGDDVRETRSFVSGGVTRTYRTTSAMMKAEEISSVYITLESQSELADKLIAASVAGNDVDRDDFLSPIFGPYTVDSMVVTGGAKIITLSGSLGTHLDYLLTDTDLESTFYNSLFEQLDKLLDIEPYSDWQSGKRGAGTIYTKEGIIADITLKLLNISGLADLQGVFEEYGMAVRPYTWITNASVSNNDRLRDIQPQFGLALMPLYPLTTSPYISDEQFAPWGFNNLGHVRKLPPTIRPHVDWIVDEDDTITLAHSTDRLGRYRTRQIKGSQRPFSDFEIDVEHFNQGDPTDIPPVYLRQFTDARKALVSADVMRWNLQYESMTAKLTRRNVDTYVVPRHKVLYDGRLWLITNTSYTFNETEGLSLEADLALVQGDGDPTLADVTLVSTQSTG